MNNKYTRTPVKLEKKAVASFILNKAKKNAYFGLFFLVQVRNSFFFNFTILSYFVSECSFVEAIKELDKLR